MNYYIYKRNRMKFGIYRLNRFFWPRLNIMKHTAKSRHKMTLNWNNLHECSTGELITMLITKSPQLSHVEPCPCHVISFNVYLTKNSLESGDFTSFVTDNTLNSQKYDLQGTVLAP